MTEILEIVLEISLVMHSVGPCTLPGAGVCSHESDAALRALRHRPDFIGHGAVRSVSPHGGGQGAGGSCLCRGRHFVDVRGETPSGQQTERRQSDQSALLPIVTPAFPLASSRSIVHSALFRTLALVKSTGR